VLLVEPERAADVAEAVGRASLTQPSAASAAVEALLAHRKTVFLICLGFARNRGDAEDLAQETYLHALRRVPELRDETLLKAWLCRIARNTCLDHLRRAKLRRFIGLAEAPEPRTPGTPETLLQNEERYLALRAAVVAMPGKLRDVLVLREYGELAYQEIAVSLGIEPGTVMSRLHRARAWLASRLGKEATS
jgi:RNA polymerase sigma-70 factor (ECF subfamily)